VEKEKQFNGYANYETWAVALWLANDYESYQRWRSESRQELEQARRSEKFWAPARETAAISLAERLQLEIAEAAPEDIPPLYADLLRAALAEVDWYEVAIEWLDDIQQEERP
jgi:hypothetical protein